MKEIAVAVDGTIKVIKVETIVVGAKSTALIQAIPNADYIITSFFTDKLAAENIVTQRQNSDLLISVNDDTQTESLIIEGFYDSPNNTLVGLGQDGSYYTYLPESGIVSDAVVELSTLSPPTMQVMGGGELANPWWTTAAEANSALPWLLGAGAAVGAGVLLLNDDDDKVIYSNKIGDVPDTSINKPVISIDNITADNVLDSTELAQPTVTITGTLSNVDADVDASRTQVTLKVGDKDITAAVTGNTYSADVATADLQGNTSIVAVVAIADQAGNTISSDAAAKTYTVNATPPNVPDTSINKPVISIDNITADNVLDSTELAQPTVTITGTLSNVDADVDASRTQVTLKVGDKDITAAVTGNTYSADVATADLQGNTSIVAVVAIADQAGNTISSDAAAKTYTVNATPPNVPDTSINKPVVSIDNITADNVLDSTELAQPTVTITGTLSNVDADVDASRTQVTLKVGDKDITAAVTGNTYSADVATADLQGNTSIVAVVAIADQAGNTISSDAAAKTYSIALDTPTININNITPDNIINKVEASSDTIDVLGIVSNVKDGTAITLTVGQTEYKGLIANGGFIIKVDSDNLVNNKTVTAKLTDEFNQTVVHEHRYSVDTDILKPVITINNVTQDNIVDYQEANGSITLTGSVTNVKNGEVIDLVVGGIKSSTSVVDGKFSIAVAGSLIADNTSVIATIGTHDIAGNTASANSEHVYKVDLTKPFPVIIIDDIAVDNILNISEASSPVNVTGTVSGLAAGESITVSNGQTAVQTQVGAGGKFSVEFGSNVMAQGSDITVTVADSTNNAAIKKSKSYDKDLSAPTATIKLDDVTEDNVINLAENKGNITLTGQISVSDAQAATQVKVTVGNETFDATVDNVKNTFSVAVDSRLLVLNTNVTADITVTDAAGNVGSNTTSKRHAVDTSIDAVITFDKIATDNSISPAEAAADVKLSGKVTGEYKENDSMVITVGDQTYATKVAENGDFFVMVSGSTLVTNANKTIDAALTTTDAAGNTATVESKSGKYVVETNDVTLSLDPITDDNSINVSETTKDILISGKASAGSTGQVVEIVVGDTVYEATIQPDSSFSVLVSGQALAEVAGYSIDAQLKSNPLITTSQPYRVMNYVAAEIQIDSVKTSHLLASQEQLIRVKGELDFSGTDYAIGENGSRIKAIDLNIGNSIYTVGINEETHHFYADVKLSDIRQAAGQDISYTLNTSDKILVISDSVFTYVDPQTGMRVPFDKTIEVKDAPVVNDSNTVINLESNAFLTANGNRFTVNEDAIENQSVTVVTGHAIGSAQAGDVVSVAIGEQKVNTVLEADRSFVATVDTTEVAALVDSNVTATLTTKDLAGKPITVEVDTTHEQGYSNNGSMVHWTGMLGDFDDLPYFIQSLDIQTYYPHQKDSFGYLADHEYGNKSGSHEITYYFADTEDARTYKNSDDEFLSNPIAFSETNKAVVSEGLNLFSKYLDINFTIADSMQNADITYFMAELNGGTLANSVTLGYANFGGNVHLASEVYGDDGNSTGSLDTRDGFVTVVHETMHTFAATHSFEEFPEKPPMFLPEDIDSLGVSLMSYDDFNDFNESKDLRIYDLAYLQYRFGVNPKERSGDDTYNFNTFNQAAVDGDIYIWDGGGVDTFDASQEEQGVFIDLTPGSDIYNDISDVGQELFAVSGELVSKAADYFPNDVAATDDFIIMEYDESGSPRQAGYKDVEVVYNFTEGHSFIGYGTQIERVYGSDFNDSLTGNKANNAIYAGSGIDYIDGGEGHDYIDGGLGEDQMRGGKGDDIFVINVSGDTVVENAGEGKDSVFSSANSYALTDNVENLVLLNPAIEGIGNNLNNIIEGNNLNNTLMGNDGDDTLLGGMGSDTLTGGTGKDTFIISDALNGDIDKITDFSSTENDVIELHNSIFASLSVGTTVMTHIAYDKATGELTYDSDAGGSIDPIHFATLSTNLTIDDSSFTVI